MPKKPTNKTVAEWAAEAEADLRQLGFDPRSPEDWRRYAILRFWELITGIEKPGEPETIEVNKRAFDASLQHATHARMLVIELRQIDTQYRKLRSPRQRDVLEHAVRSLEAISDYFDPLSVSQFGGLPTPLQILIPELLNVLDDRLSRLLSPADHIVRSAREVADSNKDLIRVTVQAYAAAVVHRLIGSKSCRTQNDAYKKVANALAAAGFQPPGKKKTRSYTPAAIRNWYESAPIDSGPLQQRYEQALEATPEDPDHALELLATHVRSFQFKRGKNRAA